MTVADTGFPRWGANPREGRQLIMWQDFCLKLHGNERNWTGGVRIPSIPQICHFRKKITVWLWIHCLIFWTFFGEGEKSCCYPFCNLKVFISIKVNLLGQKHNHSSSFADSLCNIDYYWNSRHKVSHVKNHLESMIFLQNWCRSIVFH